MSEKVVYTIKNPQYVQVNRTSFNEMYAVSKPKQDWVNEMYENHRAKEKQQATGLLGNRNEEQSKKWLGEVWDQLKTIVDQREPKPEAPKDPKGVK